MQPAAGSIEEGRLNEQLGFAHHARSFACHTPYEWEATAARTIAPLREVLLRALEVVVVV
ncbi:MAG TPA: hypothetical protein VH186_04810 [Chloroflexia bacterium]|nr:hypothetical protein [Chloroflexia bacterium]